MGVVTWLTYTLREDRRKRGRKMKSISVTFTDEEGEQLIKLKGVLSWHDFILTLVEKEDDA